ncbi:MAG: zinc ribbon domain-containing protein [Clostridia bacterium]|nr:zinc ribbon domain-containing protein [Clostridia bacterium]MBR2377795.1 zinc ribbon domain-containing protein [Clostridia bacterium]
MICKKCSADIPDGGVFCPMCGTRADGNITCPNCQKLIPENSIFCPFCGIKMIENTVESKDTPTTETTTENEVVDAPKTENVESENNVASVTPVVVPVVVPVATVATTIPETTEDNDVDNEEVLIEEESEETLYEEEIEEDAVVDAIICTQCGSTAVELISEDLGKCKNCGTQVVINKQKETNYVTNNVTIEMSGNAGEESIGFFELPKEIDETTFYANSLTEIALDKNSPEDVFVIGKFEAVKTEYRQYLLGKGTAEMTYTATVGYDKIEKYQTTENKYLSMGDVYTCNGVTKRADYNGSFRVDTIKERKVTDWQPFSGSHTGEYFKAVANDNNTDIFDPDDYKDYCLASSKEYDASISKLPAPLAPTSSSIDRIEDGIKTLAELDCKSKLPGDKNKDFNCDGVVTLSRIESHVAPQYILKYKYLNKDYTLKAHSAKKSMIRGDIPSAKSETETEIEDNVYVKTFNIITLFTLLFSILSSLCFPIVAKIIFAIIGVVSFITYWAIRSKVSKEIYYQKTAKKKNDLIAHLKKKGIAIPNKLKGGA